VHGHDTAGESAIDLHQENGQIMAKHLYAENSMALLTSRM
jgi:hypothetical protein